MRAHRWIITAVLVSLGITALAVGVAVPHLTAYRVGVVLLAAGLALAAYLLIRARVTDPNGPAGRVVIAGAVVVALVVPLAAGVAVPRLVADAGTWSAKQYAPVATSAAGQTYLIGPARVTVVTTDGGEQVWQRDTPGRGAGSAVVNTKGAVAMLEDGRPTRLYAADGTVLWEHPPTRVDEDYYLVAFDRHSTVVVSDCAVGRLRCHVVAVDAHGTVSWQRAVHTTDNGAERMRRISKDTRRDGTAPETVAVVEKTPVTGTTPTGVRVTMLDARTGSTQGSTAVPRGARLGFDSPYPTRDGVLISFDRSKSCEWRMYESGEQVWDLKGSTFCSDPGYAGSVASSPESRRIYVHDTNSDSWFTINLRSGHARSLTPEEGLDAMGPAEASRHRRLGADTILVERHRTLVATDADSGKQLWTRHMDSRVEGMVLGHGRAVVTTAYAGHNPVLLRDSEGFGPKAISVHLIDLRTGGVASTTALHGSNYWMRSLAGGALLSRSTPATDHRAPLDTDTAIYLAGT